VTFSQFFRLLFQGLQTAELWCLLSLFVVHAGGTFAVQYALWLRLPDERRQGGWNALSWGAAVLLCPIPCLTMLPFCWVTRPRPGAGHAARALVFGVLWSAAVLVAVEIVSQLVLWLFGVQIAGM
jgi:hypothetical protein